MSSEIRFDERVVVVTGAGRGLGRAHALLLGARGATVVVNDPGAALDGSSDESAPADLVVEEIVRAGGSAVADRTDVSTPEGAQALVDHALSRCGRVDAVVNNAGIIRDKSFAKMDPSLAVPVVGVHLWGTFWVSQAAWPVFRAQGGGRIVNTSSTAAYLGNVGQANYASAKGGIIGLTKALALEGERFGIQVNAIAPAAATRMTDGLLADLADRLDPGLVSPLVAVLAHDSCPTTGELFHVGAGAVSRVFFAQTRGFYDADISPERLLAGWSQVMDIDGATLPMGIGDELNAHGA